MHGSYKVHLTTLVILQHEVMPEQLGLSNVDAQNYRQDTLP